ncbi:DNA-binding response regulator, partial [Rhizobium ruizarguesonis]
REIPKRRGLSQPIVQNRQQQLYDNLDVYKSGGDDHEDGRFNLRSRAVTVAFLRKLLNFSALERGEAELQEWLDGK